MLWAVEADLCGAFVLGDRALDLYVLADEGLGGGLVGEGLLESGYAGFPKDRDELAFDGFGKKDLEHLAPFFDGDDASSDHARVSDLEAGFVGGKVEFVVAFENVAEGARGDADLVISGDFGDHIKGIGGVVSCEDFGADGRLFVHRRRPTQNDLEDAGVQPVADEQIGVVAGDFGVADDHTDFTVAFETVFCPVDRSNKDF